jgi:GT2 family glycosyltransferase
MTGAIDVVSSVSQTRVDTQPPKIDLSIICVNWNSITYLRDCIASIYQNRPKSVFEIIVVDNASPEGGIETLQCEFPEVKIIINTQNVGFAGANNVGFRASSGDAILLLNPDT